ncbi:MAG: hypothetical protein ABJX35_01610 [Hyphomicrobiales bacterium]
MAPKQDENVRFSSKFIEGKATAGIGIFALVAIVAIICVTIVALR